MFQLTARPPAQSTGLEPGRLLQELSACTYHAIDTFEFERRMQERTSTNGLLGSMLSASYDGNAAKYVTLPKTKEEAAERGARTYDALQVSISGLRVDTALQSGTGILSPVRYSVIDEYKALRKDLLDRRDIPGLEALHAENPLVVGSAVYIVAPYNGEPHIFMQIKGNAVGAGEIHSAAAAGGISTKEFENSASVTEMFDQAAIRQTQEEIGLQLSARQLGRPTLFRREDATGTAAVGYVIRGLRGEDILDAYSQHIQNRKILSSDDSASGLVLLPLRGGREVLLDHGSPSLAGLKEFHVNKNGSHLARPEMPRKLRPAAQGLLASLSSSEKFYRKVLGS